MRRTTLLLVLMAIAAVSYAQKVQKVTATYTYHVPENVTLEQAKRTALDRAKLQAIADEFGTIVSQSNATVISNMSGETESQFYSFGGSEVKGEWIETIGDPKYNIQYVNQALVITCSVTGKAREIENAQIEFVAKPLRNGTELKFESTEFKDGDDLYLYFESPVSGYLSVYLLDEITQTVYCILPYKEQSFPAIQIDGNKKYVFFSRKNAEKPEKPIVDEYTLSCEKEKEFNTIYLLFSLSNIGKRNGFTSITDKPDNIPFKKFKQWLSKTLSQNTKIQFQEINISISK